MPFLDNNYKFGVVAKDLPKEFVTELEKMYYDIARAVNGKVDRIVETRDPTTSDVNFRLNTIWVRKDTAGVWVLTLVSGTPPSATWTAV